MKITQQLSIEGPLAFCENRLRHQPNTVFWLLLEMCEKCPSISLQYAKGCFKDTFSKEEIKQALKDAEIIFPLWGIEGPTKDGPNYDDNAIENGLAHKDGRKDD